MLLQHNCYRAFLREELARRVRSNPRYSQRAFARQLGVSAGEISEVLSGKRELSLKSALKITLALNLNTEESRHLIELIQKSKNPHLTFSPKTTVSNPSMISTREISLDLFHIVSDWSCFALLNLAECEDFQSDKKWMARRLGISGPEVEVSLFRLEKAGLIKKIKGKWVPTPDYVISPDGIPSEALRNYHREMLGRAVQALDFQSIEERQNIGLGFAVNPSDLPRIKKEISHFVDELVKRFSRKKGKKEVYHLELALFKLTQGAGYVH